jgi:hypothetical protein
LSGNPSTFVRSKESNYIGNIFRCSNSRLQAKTYSSVHQPTVLNLDRDKGPRTYHTFPFW